MSENVTLTVGEEAYPGRLNKPSYDTELGVLMIPGAGHGPFGDVFLRFARKAADEGYAVARFETWVSPDDLDAKTEEEYQADIEAGVEFLRSQGCSTNTVVAKSFGGRLALKHLPEGVDRLVLWAPAVLAEGTEAHAPEKLRDMFPSLGGADLKAIEIPVRVLQGDEDNIPVESAERVAEQLPQGELVELPGEDHSFLRDHARVIEETIEFLPEQH